MVKKYAIKGTSELRRDVQSTPRSYQDRHGDGGMTDLMHLANTMAQTPCVVCANAVDRDGRAVCAAADSVVRLTNAARQAMQEARS